MNNIITVTTALLALSVFTTPAISLAQANDQAPMKKLVIDIQACASKQDDEQRLICFDTLASSFGPADNQVATSSEPQPTTLPEDIGGGKFSDGTEEDEGVRGHVTSCQKSVDGKWFYIFESGQVWKQTDRAKRRYRECDFYVTITEDGFGYKMRVDDETRTTRIRRHR